MKNKRVLIAYGTRFGSTKTISEDIARHLSECDIETDLMDITEKGIKNMPDLEIYQGIIVGAGVAMFRIHQKIKKYLKIVSAKIKSLNMPFVYFVTAGYAVRDPKYAKKRYIERVIQKLDLNPTLTMAVEPCMIISSKTPPNVRAICSSLAKDAHVKYNANGMNDFRNPARFNKFLDDIAALFG